MTKLDRTLLIVSLFTSMFPFSTTVKEQHPLPKLEWSYEGSTAPEFWGELDPAFKTCAKGVN